MPAARFHALLRRRPSRAVRRDKGVNLGTANGGAFGRRPSVRLDRSRRAGIRNPSPEQPFTSPPEDPALTTLGNPKPAPFESGDSPRILAEASALQRAGSSIACSVIVEPFAVASAQCRRWVDHLLGFHAKICSIFARNERGLAALVCQRPKGLVDRTTACQV
jgi:hypothetical protein